jgi:hypothetical protein
MKVGVYYGWARLNDHIYQTALSVGWNPFYKNVEKTFVRISINANSKKVLVFRERPTDFICLFLVGSPFNRLQWTRLLSPNPRSDSGWVHQGRMQLPIFGYVDPLNFKYYYVTNNLG